MSRARALGDFLKPTESAAMPVGTTAQRPASPAAGMFRQNSTTGEPEWYDSVNDEWIAFRIEPDRSYSVEYLVIAGGGGGGRANSTASSCKGAGGAGGYRSSVSGESSGGGASAESPLTLQQGTSYTVTIGAGGATGGGPPTGDNNIKIGRASCRERVSTSV